MLASWPFSRRLTPGVSATISAVLRLRACSCVAHRAPHSRFHLRRVHLNIGFYRRNAQSYIDGRLLARNDGNISNDYDLKSGDNDGCVVTARGKTIEGKAAREAGY